MSNDQHPPVPHAEPPASRAEMIDDGFGGCWKKCGYPDCGLQVVRPGKVQCDCSWEGDPENAERFSWAKERVWALESELAASASRVAKLEELLKSSLDPLKMSKHPDFGTPSVLIARIETELSIPATVTGSGREVGDG